MKWLNRRIIYTWLYLAGVVCLYYAERYRDINGYEGYNILHVLPIAGVFIAITMYLVNRDEEKSKKKNKKRVKKYKIKEPEITDEVSPLVTFSLPLIKKSFSRSDDIFDMVPLPAIEPRTVKETFTDLGLRRELEELEREPIKLNYGFPYQSPFISSPDTEITEE